MKRRMVSLTLALLFASSVSACGRNAAKPIVSDAPVALTEVFQTLRDGSGLDSPNILGWFLLWSWFVVAVVVASVVVCFVEAVDSGLTDGFTTALVFVVWGDVTDCFVESCVVVVLTDSFKLDRQSSGFCDR